MTEPIESSGLCFNCGKSCTSDFYCFGCKTYVCDKCEAGYSKATAAMHGHVKEDHLVESEEEG